MVAISSRLADGAVTGGAYAASVAGWFFSSKATAAGVRSYRTRRAGTGGALRRQHRPIQGSSVAASHWILPALGDFYSAHPDIRLHLVCVDELPGIESKGFDLEVRFGVGGWADALSYPLLDEVVFPVASPRLLDKTPIKSRKDLLRVPLLQLAEFTGPWMDWQRWLPSGRKSTEQSPTIRKFTTYAMLLEAAIYGHGVALGWKYYVAPALQRGELRICLDERRSSRFQEYLVVHRDRANDAAVRRVADWVRVYADETRARFSNY